MDEKIRVIVAKPGLDGDRGAKVIAPPSRPVFRGHPSSPAPEQVVNAALQGDADVIGLSVLSGAHDALPASWTS
jgi:methylmalonyl-CoA mutase C-terminal domain/subunit